ncbi:hypothetical protein PDESU_03702 [Pontiella desulfatans]|uniref:Uncharacterized protein n=1 Tax=Pontiella desulfatans TaxID=2750659 RepID=A0A6C2U4Y5_PONDE|nr:SUMF1/EgtB/PvdO family nonheme iron enzyme [Pontiella desulfatans]VGO15122.1 hypothetical protein PDESU_03702 [Pontiella desulfatans]
MKKYALVVGIETYKKRDFIQSLDYAVDDAERINNFLSAAGYRTKFLPGEKADNETISDHLERICKKIKSEDTFLFYFSGHGVQKENMQYILPYNADAWSLKNGGAGNALTLDEIASASCKPGVHRILIIDACRKPLEKGKTASGEFDGVSEKAIAGVLKQANKHSPLSILCSCYPGQCSYELQALEGGVFTHALERVFYQYRERGDRIDLPHITGPVRAEMARLLKEKAGSHSQPFEQDPYITGGYAVILDGHPAYEVSDGTLKVKGSDKPLGFGDKPGVEKEIVIAPSVSMTFCWCPSTDSEDWKNNNGDHDFFMMGMPASRALNVNSSEQQETRIKQGFWISKFPVTQTQYLAVTKINPSFFQEGDERDRCPVESVSFCECSDFMHRLSPPTNWKFRLPSNVEWEYAARAGAKGVLPIELQRDSLYGLVVALSRSAWVEMPESIGTVPVGSKNSNEWGLCDILGNVWEWCEGSGNSVLRGGSWSTRSTECHLSSEMNCKEDFKNNTTGFRLVLAPSGQNL